MSAENVNTSSNASPPRPVVYEEAWEFYRRIGSPKYIVAPMVDQSELPFRMLCRKYKADLAYTPMFHAALFSRDKVYREKHFTTCPEERPVIVQFCANDPDILLAAAKFVEDRCDAVDINLGCPQGIAKRGHYGSFLLEETDLIVRMVQKLHQNLKVPVTCKIRMLPTEEATLNLARAIQAAGCSILTVHGRTREMKKDKVGANNFDIIKRVKQELSIPVFSNGGISNLADVERCLAYTGVDGVMVSEALLDNPALFTGAQVDPVVMAQEYISMTQLYPGADDSMIRGHLFKILHQRLSVFTDLREALGRTPDPESVIPLVREAETKTPDALERYQKFPTWYSRHLTFKKPWGGAGGDKDKAKNKSKGKEATDEKAGFDLDGLGDAMDCFTCAPDNKVEMKE